MSLIDRDRERRALKQIADDPQSRLGVLYGRRRVGKTFLLDSTWDDQRVFYFLAGKTTSEQNRVELLEDLKQEIDPAIEPDQFTSWRAVFRLLVDCARGEPLVVVLDEFQYFLDSDSQTAEVTSSLAAVWDREVDSVELTLVLCGSEISTMKHLNDADRPLHGRISYFERLTPFDYYDAAKMMGRRPLREYVRTYGIYGGMPAYLAEIDPDNSLKKHVCRNILLPSGPVYNFLDTLFKMEQGIREPGKYRAILTAVARGNTEVNEIAQASGVTGARNEPARRKLKELLALFLIRRERNFGVDGGAYRYYVDDPAVQFWYRFVHENRKRLEQGNPGSIWEHRIRPRLSDYIGPVFERICYQAFCRFAEQWELSYPTGWERWEGKDRNGDSLEIDVVSELDDQRLLVGEIKWSRSPVAGSLHHDLTNKLERLKNSGVAWAHRAHEGRDIHYIYFSAGGFTEPFRDMADDSLPMTLINLEDLYPDMPY